MIVMFSSSIYILLSENGYLQTRWSVAVQGLSAVRIRYVCYFEKCLRHGHMTFACNAVLRNLRRPGDFTSSLTLHWQFCFKEMYFRPKKTSAPIQSLFYGPFSLFNTLKVVLPATIFAWLQNTPAIVSWYNRKNVRFPGISTIEVVNYVANTTEILAELHAKYLSCRDKYLII